MRRRAVQRSEEAASLALDDGPVAYRLKRSSARRSLALRVAESGEVVVNAPWSMPPGRIEAFLIKHADWLRQRLRQRPQPHVWRDGVALPYLGGHLTLDWLELPPSRRASSRIDSPYLHVEAGAETLPTAVERWYHAAARADFAERLARHSARMGVAPPPMRLSNARTRWGSLSPQGVVSLNWRLVKAAPAIIDYVVCHELAHLRQRNHSPAFWREVAALYPDFAAARAHLRQEGRRYFEF